MAEKEPVVVKEGEVAVPQKLLETMQTQMAEMERKLEEESGKRAGLEAMVEAGAGANALGEPKLREKKTYEPKFRTARLRKYPRAGAEPEFIVGWTSKGAYQEVDRSGVAPVIVDYLDVIFLGHERNKEGKLSAEKVKLLDILNKGEQVHCRIVSMQREDKMVPTGEEIDITMFDPQHGLMSTGDKIDGYITNSEIKYTLQVPGHEGTVVVDGEFCNL